MTHQEAIAAANAFHQQLRETQAANQQQQQLIQMQHQYLQAAQQQATAHHSSLLKPKSPDAFSGMDRRMDVETWLFQVEKFFNVARAAASDVERIDYATLLFKDAALTWWRALSATNQTPTTWLEFKDLLQKQFLPINSVRLARDRLAQLKQTGPVRDYAFKMRLTFLEIPTMSEDEKLDRFIRGLKPHIRREVELRNPTQLETAVAQAEIVDANSMRVMGPGRHHFPARRSYAAVAGGPAPMDLDAMQRRPRTPPTPKLRNQNGPRRQQLSRSNDQLNQLCYYCHEPGHRIAQCPQRPSGNATRPALQQPSGGR
jgi:hypothetical protein